MASAAAARREPITPLLGVGAATAAAHIGNNFTTYLIGGLIDRYGFSSVQMGAWSMTETLAYALAMFFVAPRAAALSPRRLLVWASVLVVVAQCASAACSAYALLLVGRIATGLGFGLANTALNLAAARTDNPARAISVGIACQTVLYAAINIGLPMLGAAYGVGGMFVALGILSAVFALGTVLLPDGRPEAGVATAGASSPIDRDGWRVLVAMALFTFGSLAIWPFMERAAHAIQIPAVIFGRFQSVATLASALGNLLLAAWVARLRRSLPIAIALVSCGAAAALLTTATAPLVFGFALILYNTSWFVTYPLLLGLAYAVDPRGRLSVLCSGVWLAMMSLGSLVTGTIAELFGGYVPVGPMGLAFCLAAIVAAWPLARRLDTSDTVLRRVRPARTG